MALLIYEGIFSRPESIKRVRAAIPAITRLGGRVVLSPPTSDGMVIITLSLPPPLQPKDFFPDLPFTLA